MCLSAESLPQKNGDASERMLQLGLSPRSVHVVRMARAKTPACTLVAPASSTMKCWMYAATGCSCLFIQQQHSTTRA